MSRTACTITVHGDRQHLKQREAADYVRDAIAWRYPDATPDVHTLRLGRRVVAVTVVGLDAAAVAGVTYGYGHEERPQHDNVNGLGFAVGIAGHDAGKSYVGNESACANAAARPVEFVR